MATSVLENFGLRQQSKQNFCSMQLGDLAITASKEIKQQHTLAHTHSADTTKLTTMRARRQHEKN